MQSFQDSMYWFEAKNDYDDILAHEAALEARDFMRPKLEVADAWYWESFA